MTDSIIPEQLYAMRRSGDCILIDIRREQDLEADGTVIPGAIRGNPESVDIWAKSLPAHPPIIVYCARGGSVSKSVTPALRARSLDANYIEGGIAAWKDFGGEVVSARAVGCNCSEQTPSRLRSSLNCRNVSDRHEGQSLQILSNEPFPAPRRKT